MDNPLASVFFCFSSCFPPSRSRESVQDLAPEYSSARGLPAYTGRELDPEKDAPFTSSLAVPRYLPVDPRTEYSINFVTLDPPRFEPPPYYPGLTKQKPLLSTLEPKPLRLVRDSRKRKPPVSYSHNSKYHIQSTSYYIAVEHTSASSTAISSASLATMSTTTTPAMPKAAPTLPNGPRPGGAPPSKDEILADLRRQVSPAPFPTPIIPPRSYFPFFFGCWLSHISTTARQQRLGLRRRLVRLFPRQRRPSQAQARQQGPGGKRSARTHSARASAPTCRHQAGAAPARAEPRRRARAQGSPAGRRCPHTAVMSPLPRVTRPCNVVEVVADGFGCQPINGGQCREETDVSHVDGAET